MHRALIVAAGAAAVFAVGLSAGWAANGWRLKGAIARIHAEHAAALARAVEAARQEDNRRANALLEVVNAATENLSRASRDRDAARAAADRLRQHAQDLAARCRAPGDSAPAPGGPPAPAPGDLLAELLGRIDRAAGDLAAHADRAMSAGRACERAYDSLRK